MIKYFVVQIESLVNLLERREERGERREERGERREEREARREERGERSEKREARRERRLEECRQCAEEYSQNSAGEEELFS